MKILRKTVITLLILASLFIGGGLLVSHFYGDEVKDAVIGRLNQKLRMKVDVEKVDFSVLRKFPYASVGLSQVVLSKGSDSLFHFQDVFLQFDLVDLFQGQKKIERISFENGDLRLPIDRNGKHPYQRIWKGKTEQKDSASRFELERVEWENVEFHYSDERSGAAFRTTVSYAFLQGNFTKKGAQIRARADGNWKSFRLKERSWETIDRSFSIETQGRIDHAEKRAVIDQGSMTWKELEGKVRGVFDYGKDPRIELHYEFPFHPIEEYLQAWPDLNRFPDPYGIQGELRLQGEWAGPMGSGQGPVFEGSMELRNGEIRHKSSGIQAKSIKANGHFSTRKANGQPLIALKKFSGKLGGGDWKGKGHWIPGDPHELKLHVKGNSRVKESVRFLGIDTLRRASGKWKANLRVKGKLSGFDRSDPKDLENTDISGRAELVNADLAVKGSHHRFEGVDGTFLLHGDDAAVKKLTGKVTGDRMELEGRFFDLLPYLFLPERTLRIKAELRSKKVNLGRLLSNDDRDRKKAYSLSFPKDIRCELATDIGLLKFRKFKAKELTGRIELGPGGITGKDISMKIADGQLEGHLALNGDTEPYGIRASAELKGIQVRPLFKAFEGFGQELIRPEHLKGVLDAGIQYNSSLKKDLLIPPSSVKSSADLELRKGELIEFQPLIELGKELANKKILNSFLDLEGLRDQLLHVRFETLKNRIRIENEKTIIPRFHVRSNALDITASGEHGFDGSIEYHFVILMDELLSKPKKSKFGYLRKEGNKKRLFVKMTGTSEDPQISFDRKAAKEFRQKHRKKEKEEIKEVLRKEFGLFGGKDSASTREKEKGEEKGDPVFDVQWGDEKAKKEKRQKEEKEEEKSLWDRLGIGNDEEKEKQDEKEN
ncbi:MAG: AsmA-like C-terminal region-containing protein [Flavobacteriales bacterium]